MTTIHHQAAILSHLLSWWNAKVGINRRDKEGQWCHNLKLFLHNHCMNSAVGSLADIDLVYGDWSDQPQMNLHGLQHLFKLSY